MQSVCVSCSPAFWESSYSCSQKLTPEHHKVHAHLYIKINFKVKKAGRGGAEARRSL